MDVDGRQAIQYKLRKYRRLRGLKQDAVRKKLGLGSRCTLSNWENGKSFPSIPRLTDLARLYGCAPVHLYPHLGEIPEDTESADEEEL